MKWLNAICAPTRVIRRERYEGMTDSQYYVGSQLSPWGPDFDAIRYRRKRDALAVANSKRLRAFRTEVVRWRG